MQRRCSRSLIWIPIIHTPADLGSLRTSVQTLFVGKMGAEQWRRHTDLIAAQWQAIRRQIHGRNLAYERTRLYQDGLPVCGHENQIVADLAGAGSVNHQILMELAARGAHLTGTESPELLLEEYELARQILVGAETKKKPSRSQRDLGQLLLARRDRFIGKRIDQTLQSGETGLLFLGLLHSLEGFLPPSIRVERWNHLVPSGAHGTVGKQRRSCS